MFAMLLYNVVSGCSHEDNLATPSRYLHRPLYRAASSRESMPRMSMAEESTIVGEPVTTACQHDDEIISFVSYATKRCVA